MSSPPPPANAIRKENGNLSPARRRLRLLIWLLVLAIVGPCAYLEAPREMARWYLAGARVERHAGKKDLAYTRLAQALGWTPDSPELLMQRAQWRVFDGEFAAALDDLNAGDKLLPDNVASLELRSQVLLALGRHEESLALWDKLDRLSQTTGIRSRANVLNSRAYYRAVANVDLEEALTEVGQALSSEPGNASYLDTRGYIYYRQGKYDAALADINPALAGIQREHSRLAEQIASKQMLIGPRDPEGELELLSFGTAVVRYHRALVLEKLGRQAEAAADREQVKQLIGREPDDTLF